MKVAAVLALISWMGTVALARTVEVGSLVIGPVWTRATPPGASTAAGYLTIRNAGAQTDRLVGVELEGAVNSGLHESVTSGGTSRMRMVDAITIHAESLVELKPGGMHVMFNGLAAPLRQGEAIPGALIFEKAGRVRVEFRVERIGAMQPHPE